MSSKIFISYRRNDSKAAANRLRQTLEDLLDKDIVFMDTEDITAGVIWKEKIKNAMMDSGVVLLIIGKNFHGDTEENKHRKIGGEDDWLSYEVKTAIDLGKTLIPVLVDQAEPPNPIQLKTMPQFIQDAFERQCFQLSLNQSVEEVKKLINCFIDKLDLEQKFRYVVRRDKYRIDELISEGTTANVYLAFEIPLERKVAIKVVKDTYAEEFRKVLKDAMKLAIRAPNSVQIYDAYFWAKPFHAVMNYLGKNSFRQLIDNTYSQNKIIDIAKVRDYLLQIADALKNAHKDNVTHCNIKPSNIMKGDNDVAYLSPLCMLNDDEVNEAGIRKRFFSEAPNIKDARYKEDLCYISPEILGDKEDFNSDDRKKIDQYMLGMFGYELLRGCMPIDAETFDDLKMKSPDIFQHLPNIIQKRDDCPNELSDIIMKMLSADPDDRFPSLNKVVQKLSEIAFDDIEIAKASYLRCLAGKREGPGFIETFYESFIKVSGEAEQLFKTSGKFDGKEGAEQQYKKLSASILHLFFYAQDNGNRENPVEPNSLSWIAEHHQHMGITSYDEFKNTLIKTVLEFDEQCRTNTSLKKIRTAWENVLAPGIRYMQGKKRD